MNTLKKSLAVLFDLDGVVMDTESQYSLYWDRKGIDCLGIDDFAAKIKGQTLPRILDTYFPHWSMEDTAALEAELMAFERDMPCDYIPGARALLEELRTAQVPTAIVTSSSQTKMQSLYGKHPELPLLVNRVFTSEAVARSKPAPDCFLHAMEQLNLNPAFTFIFEDSLSGLQAARAAGGIVVGVATTYPRAQVAPLADIVVDDLTQINPARLRMLP